MGKTTCAAAAAVAAADRGRRVLAVSTDPAHSLGDALEAKLSAVPRAVRVPRGRLLAVELDADRALARWLKARLAPLRTIAERGTYLDREDVDRFLSLSFPGVDELVGLLELSRLVREVAPDEVVVDTAPTGHTLRLLEMPDTLARLAGVLDGMHAKHRFMARSLGGRYRADAADALVEEVQRDAEGLRSWLREPGTRFTWVMLPEWMSLEETTDGVGALKEAHLAVDELVVNGLTAAPPARCRLCTPRRGEEAAVLDEARRRVPGVDLTLRPQQPAEPRGRRALLRFARARVTTARPARSSRRAPPRSARAPTPPWLDAVAPTGVPLLLFGGKGGVGKTSAACAVAVGVAGRKGAPPVLLLSADPAHSLADALLAPLGDAERSVPGAPPSLRARELDADAAWRARRERYRSAVDALFDALRRGSMDASFDRAVVQDLIELAPPGLDELFAILAVVDELVPGGGGRPRTLVLDTAPTGHALRLLALPETAQEWVKALMATVLKYREAVGLGALAEELVDLSKRLRALSALLHDPGRARLVVVTRPAALPRLETARLLQATRRMKVPIGAVVVNGVTEGPGLCTRCRARARVEARELAAYRTLLARALPAGVPRLVAPAVAPPPRGPAALARWAASWRTIAQ